MNQEHYQTPFFHIKRYNIYSSKFKNGFLDLYNNVFDLQLCCQFIMLRVFSSNIFSLDLILLLLTGNIQCFAD